MLDVSLALVTPPAVEPVSLIEAKHHANVVEDDDDTLLESYLQSARELVERDTDRSLITQTWRRRLRCFPCKAYIRLPRPPLQSVTSIEYYDEHNSLQELDAENYSVDTDREPGVVWLNSDSVWPGTYERHDAVTVTYVAGYGAAAEVPRRAKQAILLLVAHWFRNREAVTAGVTKEIELAYRSLTQSLSRPAYP